MRIHYTMSTPTYLEVNISQLQNLDISGNTTIVGNTTMGGNITLTGNTTSNSNIKIINNSSSTVLGIQNAPANQYCNLSLSGISYTGNLNPKSTTAIVGMTSVGGDYSVLQD